MNVTINGNNITIRQEFEAYAKERLNKLGRYLPNILDIHVDLDQQHNSRGLDYIVAQITLRHQRGAILRTEERVTVTDHDAPKQALNAALDKMYRQIERFKGKRRSISRKLHERFSATMEELAIAEPIPDDAYENYEAYIPDAEQQEAPLTRYKKVSVMPMNEEEAIEQMELLGHAFFMFLNAETQQINVLYRRDNGGYGVLQPQLG